MDTTRGIVCGGSMSSYMLCACDTPLTCDKDPMWIALKPKEDDSCVAMSGYGATLNFKGDLKFPESIRVKSVIARGIFSENDVVCQESEIPAIEATRDVFLIQSKYDSAKAGGNIHWAKSDGKRLETKTGNVFLYFKDDPKRIHHINGKVGGDLRTIHPVVYLKNFQVGGAVIFPEDIKNGTIHLDKNSSIGDQDKTNGTIIRRKNHEGSTSGESRSDAAASSSDAGVTGSSSSSDVAASSATPRRVKAKTKSMKRKADDMTGSQK